MNRLPSAAFAVLLTLAGPALAAAQTPADSTAGLDPLPAIPDTSGLEQEMALQDSARAAAAEDQAQADQARLDSLQSELWFDRGPAAHAAAAPKDMSSAAARAVHRDPLHDKQPTARPASLPKKPRKEQLRLPRPHRTKVKR